MTAETATALFPYRYAWSRMGRKGQRCRVLARGKLNTVLVEFEDGYRATTSGNALRKMARLLDLFCGAGGAAMGYRCAGFTEIVGVDNRPMPNYPFTFVLADALEYLAGHGAEFDAIHASPPCQGYSIMRNLPWLREKEYPLLILPTLELLNAVGKPYVLENVMGARHGAKGLVKRGLQMHGLEAGWLCGIMFGLPFYRHRLFATSFAWLAPAHPKHQYRIRPGTSLGSRARDIVFSRPNPRSDGVQVPGVGIGHAVGWRLAAAVMGVDWMNREELAQAIPPAYTEFIGRRLIAMLEQQEAKHA